MPVTLILKVTLGKIILSQQNETNLLIFGHGDGSEFSEFFGRTIPIVILPFSCSSHHDSLRSPPKLLKLKHDKKFPSSELSFFALYIKMKLAIFLIKIYRKRVLNSKKKYFEGNFELSFSGLYPETITLNFSKYPSD